MNGATLIAVAVGGAAGAVARYGIASWLGGAASEGRFPMGILVANLVGCLLIGLLAGIAEGGASWAKGLRPLLVVGFLGALTTFSTFGLDTVMLLRAGAPGIAVANVLANCLGGVALAGLGLWVGMALVRA